MEHQNDLKGTWSHDEAFSSFKPEYKVYRFVSLLQCSTAWICTLTVAVRMLQREKCVAVVDFNSALPHYLVS